MDCGILREVYDDNLKRIIRLRMLQDNSVVFTTIKNNSEEVSATCLQRPILAQIRVTKNCNLNCPYCYANDSSSYQDMSYEQVIHVLDICDKQGVMAITWTGGEPLTKSFFPDLVKYTYALGIRQTILTNGTLLEIVLNEDFPKVNLNFQISLNNVWDDIQSNDIVIENTKGLFLAGYDVMLSVMLESVPIERYEELIQRMVKNKIPKVKFGLKVLVGAASQENADQYERAIRSIIPDLLSLKRKYENQIKIEYQFDKVGFHFTGLPRRFLMCEAGTTQIYIDNNGDVYPCPLLKSYHFMKCGNVFVDDWMELWSSEPMELLRGIDECTDCHYNCKVWCRAMKYAVDSNFYGKSHFCLKGIT